MSCRVTATDLRRRSAGSAHNNVGSGVPKASKGPATVSSRTCCTMCALNDVSAAESSGDASATATVASPAKKRIDSRVPTMDRAAHRFQRSRPTAYAIPVTTTAQTATESATGNEQHVAALQEDQ